MKNKRTIMEIGKDILYSLTHAKANQVLIERLMGYSEHNIKTENFVQLTFGYYTIITEAELAYEKAQSLT